MKIMEDKLSRKSHRKQKRAYHRLLRDMNIKCCDNPTKYMMICNAGLMTGLQRETLQNVVDPLVSKYDLVMLPNKSYCFIKFYSINDAEYVYNKIHGQIKLEGRNTPLYASFTETDPKLDYYQLSSDLPPGLRMIENFITENEEKDLLNTLNWNNKVSKSSDLKHRKVKHFGYEFEYNSNKVNSDNPIAPIPESYQFLQARFRKYDIPHEYDQLTINHYLPGQGIPPHIDTHSVFEDTILSLSLGSACIMDFKRKDKRISVLLPPLSLLILSGEARYAWSHGICPRHNDVIDSVNGITTQPRNTRVSFTFRKVKTGSCCCTFPEYCDTKDNCNTTFIDDKTARGIENSYVHEVYENISSHFDETRHNQWPNVSKFLQSLNPGDILLDIGCGNGKYLHEHEHIFKIGCDRSQNLMKICRNKNFEVFLSDCLYLPYKNNSLDAVISIAVIHHLSTHERRKQAISELARVLRPNGKCLIYVWAKEQEVDSMQTAYLKYNTTKKKNKSLYKQKLTEYGVTLPIHENRTKFTSTDMLVPWKRKGGGDFLRYYHVFQEDELAQLCSEVVGFIMKDIYYDQGNWCAILQKK
ncbi:alkylated DNA repair protein alkB homolog 8 [Colletes gigas]|uniref:alkylated DNA repair protein alkB homolog 8 n=1 Tax=Colletes gigas TaxID=935657 RepID=UPI001C9A7057|nr:alkylated DNA repair protein alkB homolog 8 [Colletes gigas]XP_043263038.1 alkylated DNA repair protein alkB homolog 8 [Colletes gigas]